VRARTSRFSAATTRSDVPATPLSLRLGAPVSQRYRDVEDALIPPIVMRRRGPQARLVATVLSGTSPEDVA
jgi:hypothetical protein